MSHDGNHAATVLVSFTLGALAGAAIALLYAPAPGEETRKRLAEKAREGRERANQMAHESKEFLNRQKEHINSAVEKGREAFDRTRKDHS